MLTLALWLAATSCAAPVQSLDLGAVRLSADRLVIEQAGGAAYAEGHVLLRTAEFWITADAATYDQEQQAAEMHGNVTVSAPHRLVHAADGRYDLVTGRAELNHVRGWDDSTGARLTVLGSRLTFQGTTWTLADADVRAGDAADPNYRLTASEIRYTQGQSWWGKDVRVEVFGVTVLKQSTFEQKVTDAPLAALQWVPTPGTSPQDGLFAQWAVQRDVLGDMRFRGWGRVATRSGLSGAARLEKPIGDSAAIWGTAGYRELVGDLVRPELRWNHIEGGADWRLTSRDAAWRVDARASYGQIWELPTAAHSRRTAVTLEATSRPFIATEDTRGYVSLGARAFAYSTGQRYGDLWGGVFASHRFGRDERVWGALLAHAIRGSTPFETDRVEMPLELRLGGRVGITDRWAAESEIRYDVLETRTRHTEASLRYRSADFTYRLRYNVDRGYFAVDLLLPD